MDKERHNRNYHINIGKYCHSGIRDEVYALTNRDVTNIFHKIKSPILKKGK